EIDFPLDKGFGEQRPQRLDIARDDIGALGIGVACGQLFDLGHVSLTFKGLYVPPQGRLPGAGSASSDRHAGSSVSLWQPSPAGSPLRASAGKWCPAPPAAGPTRPDRRLR